MEAKEQGGNRGGCLRRRWGLRRWVKKVLVTLEKRFCRVFFWAGMRGDFVAHIHGQFFNTSNENEKLRFC